MQYHKGIIGIKEINSIITKNEIIMDLLKKEFASKLMKVKAIKLQPENPFTWASGWKSPFYCDNRKTLSYPDLRNYVKLELVHAVLENFPEAEAVEIGRASCRERV